MANFLLNINRSSDLICNIPKIYNLDIITGGYVGDLLYLDKDIHDFSNMYIGKKDFIEIDKTKNIEKPELYNYLDEWQLTFLHNIHIAMFISKIKLYDKITFTTEKGEVLIPLYPEVKIETKDNLMAKIEITYYLDKVSTSYNSEFVNYGS